MSYHKYKKYGIWSKPGKYYNRGGNRTSSPPATLGGFLGFLAIISLVFWRELVIILGLALLTYCVWKVIEEYAKKE